MFLFPSMIYNAAVEAGMPVPPESSCESYDPNEFPHWHVYCNVQLGVPLTWGNHWENAKLIARIPQEQLRTMTLCQLEEMGFSP